MKLICITDIHGYLDIARKALRGLEEKTSLNLLQNGEWISEHKLVFNGDAFDRGPQNHEALEWVLNNANVYNLGNHEFFALFPHVTDEFLSDEYIQRTGKEGNYWRNMKDETRYRLIKALSTGEITAGYRKYNYTYTHAGAEKPDIEQLNIDLQKTGERLLEAYGKGCEKYREAQRETVWTEQTSRGTELRSKQPEIFEARREPEGMKGGIAWNRFNQLETSEKQVVGHSTGRYTKKKGYGYNPSKKGEAININSIRDSAETGKVALTVENEEELEVYEIEV